MVIFFVFVLFFIVVALRDHVHNMETIPDLCKPLTASGIFLKKYK